MNIYKYIYESGLIASGCWDKFDDYDQKALEKCIELVVRDCENKILESLESAGINASHDQEDRYWLGYRHACDDAIVDIREHFGVEE